MADPVSLMPVHPVPGDRLGDALAGRLLTASASDASAERYAAGFAAGVRFAEELLGDAWLQGFAAGVRAGRQSRPANS